MYHDEKKAQPIFSIPEKTTRAMDVDLETASIPCCNRTDRVIATNTHTPSASTTAERPS